MSPDYVTNKELQERLDKIQDRIGKLEKYLIVLACAIASPKLGGPDPASIVGAVIKFVA